MVCLQSTVAALEKALEAGDEGIDNAIKETGAINSTSAAQREIEVCASYNSFFNRVKTTCKRQKELRKLTWVRVV